MSSRRRTSLAATLALAGIGVAYLWTQIGDDTGTSFSIFLYGSALIGLANGLLTGWLRSTLATIAAWGTLILIVRLTADPDCGFSQTPDATHVATATQHGTPGNATILATVTECADGSKPDHDTATFLLGYAAALSLVPATVGAAARGVINTIHRRNRSTTT